jgi:hypothetical protein
MKNLLLTGFAGMIMVTTPALAQTLSTQGLGPIGAPGARTQGPRKVEPTPSGVPGSRAEPVAVAPAEKTPGDMPPTEALFDAINRGDLAAAKDAINRGADINGRNVLGLTPLDLSVDLGRNNISFVLLSLRGGAGYTTSSGPARTAESPRQTPADRRAAAREEAAQRRREAAQARAAAAPVAQVAPRTARLFAGDGGAPVPQAGFLGFGSAR